MQDRLILAAYIRLHHTPYACAHIRRGIHNTIHYADCRIHASMYSDEVSFMRRGEQQRSRSDPADCNTQKHEAVDPPSQKAKTPKRWTHLETSGVSANDLLGLLGRYCLCERPLPADQAHCTNYHRCHRRLGCCLRQCRVLWFRSALAHGLAL